MPFFSAASQSLSTEVLQADAESAAAAQPARLGDTVTAREAYEDQLASSFGSGAAAVAKASDGVTPLISAASQNHRMRLWWHPGLPRLTQEGLRMLVADNFMPFGTTCSWGHGPLKSLRPTAVSSQCRCWNGLA